MIGIGGALGIDESRRKYRNETKAKLAERLSVYNSQENGPEAFEVCKEFLVRSSNFEKHRRPILRMQRKAEQIRKRAEETDDELIRRHLYKQAEEADRAAVRMEATAGEKASTEQAMSQAEVASVYRRVHSPRFEEMIDRYRRGSLFLAQDWGFGTFLQATQRQQEADRTEFRKLQAYAELAGETENRDYIDAEWLFHIRIQPPVKRRQKFLTEDGDTKNPQHMDVHEKREYWAWWRAYNTATLEHRWKDDTGVAYDSTQFKPEDLR